MKNNGVVGQLAHPVFKRGRVRIHRGIWIAEELIKLYLLVGVVRWGPLGINSRKSLVEELDSTAVHTFGI